MEKQPIPRYYVEPTKATIVASITPLELKDVEAWIIRRDDNSNLIQTLGRYRDEATANTVAAILTTLADKEV